MKNFILLVLMFQIPSCNWTTVRQVEKFDPQFLVGDYQKGGITSEAKEVSCHHEEINQYACIHIDDIKQLNRILDKYRMRGPKTAMRADKIIRRMENNHAQN